MGLSLSQTYSATFHLSACLATIGKWIFQITNHCDRIGDSLRHRLLHGRFLTF